MFNFDAFLETLKTDLAGVIKDFGEDLKEDIIHDVSSLAKKNREDLERWSNELREGNLSPADFEFLLKSKKDLAEMEALEQKGLAQAKLDKLKADILDTIVGSVKKVI